MMGSWLVTVIKGSALVVGIVALALLAVPGADAAKTVVPPPVTDAARRF